MPFLEILYHAVRVYLWCAFASNHIVVLIGKTNTRRNAARKGNCQCRNSSHGDQVPPLEEDAKMEHAPVNPPYLTNENIRAALLQMAQAITTQTQVSTTQAQAMTAKANREVVPRPYQQVTTMASRLKDFTWINPPTFYGSKVNEDSREFIDEVYKILLAMGLSSSEKAGFPPINSRT